jgi:hypothetical protein
MQNGGLMAKKGLKVTHKLPVTTSGYQFHLARLHQSFTRIPPSYVEILRN